MFWETVKKPATKEQAIFSAHMVNRQPVKYQYGAKLKIYVCHSAAIIQPSTVIIVWFLHALSTLSIAALNTVCALRRRIGIKFSKLRNKETWPGLFPAAAIDKEFRNMTRKEKKNINDAVNSILKNISKENENYNAVLTIGLNAGLIPIYEIDGRRVSHFIGGF